MVKFPSALCPSSPAGWSDLGQSAVINELQRTARHNQILVLDVAVIIREIPLWRAVQGHHQLHYLPEQESGLRMNMTDDGAKCGPRVQLTPFYVHLVLLSAAVHIRVHTCTFSSEAVKNVVRVIETRASPRPHTC